MAKREKESYGIQSVTNGLNLLEQFKGDRDELGVTDLSNRMELHKNKIFRLLATLEAKGYIEQNKATENYRLGVKSLELGQAFIKQNGLVRQVKPFLKESVLDNMDKFTENTIVDRTKFIRHLKEVAKRGYAIDNEEYNSGVSCVGVPLRNYTGRVVGGISVCGPSFRMTDELLKTKIIPLVKDVGEKVSKRLGFGVEDEVD